MTTTITTEDYVTVSEDDRDRFIDDCPAWCKDAVGGHRHATFAADRTHFGDSVGVSLELEHGHSEVKNDRDTHYVEQAVAYISQNYLHREPRIHVGKSDNPGMYFTPAEARAFGEVLIQLADQADAPGRILETGKATA